jgi:hypothetical protein
VLKRPSPSSLATDPSPNASPCDASSMLDHAGCSFNVNYVNGADLLSRPETFLFALPEKFRRRNKSVE